MECEASKYATQLGPGPLSRPAGPSTLYQLPPTTAPHEKERKKERKKEKKKHFKAYFSVINFSIISLLKTVTVRTSDVQLVLKCDHSYSNEDL
jgi:hypothetical protein